MFIAHTSRKAPVKARSQRSESENDMENKNCGSPLYPKVRADGAVNPPHIRRGSLLENPPSTIHSSPHSHPHTHTHTTPFQPYRPHPLVFKGLARPPSTRLKAQDNQPTEPPRKMTGAYQHRAYRSEFNRCLTVAKTTFIKHDLRRGKKITYPRLILVLYICGLGYGQASDLFGFSVRRVLLLSRLVMIIPT